MYLNEKYVSRKFYLNNNIILFAKAEAILLYKRNVGLYDVITNYYNNFFI